MKCRYCGFDKSQYKQYKADNKRLRKELAEANATLERMAEDWFREQREAQPEKE